MSNEIKLDYKANSYYGTPGVRETCHILKDGGGTEEYKKAVAKVAMFMKGLGLIRKGDWLIPVPQHTGKAEYTLAIAERLSRLTGAHVLDIVGRIPSETWYDKKKKGDFNSPSFYLKEQYTPIDGKVFFLDNVISTGTTFAKISELFPVELKPLVYALGHSQDNESLST